MHTQSNIVKCSPTATQLGEICVQIEPYGRDPLCETNLEEVVESDAPSGRVPSSQPPTVRAMHHRSALNSLTAVSLSWPSTVNILHFVGPIGFLSFSYGPLVRHVLYTSENLDIRLQFICLRSLWAAQQRGTVTFHLPACIAIPVKGEYRKKASFVEISCRHLVGEHTGPVNWTSPLLLWWWRGVSLYKSFDCFLTRWKRKHASDMTTGCCAL